MTEETPIVHFLAPCPNGHRASQTFAADDIRRDTIDDITFYCITCDATWKPNDAEKLNALARAQREQRRALTPTTIIPKRCSACGAMLDIECEAGSGFGQMEEYADHCPAPKCGKVLRLLLPGTIVDVRLGAPVEHAPDGR